MVFRNLSRAEAEEHFRDWVDGMDERIDRFTRAVAERGPQFQRDRQGLEVLGAWILDALREGPRDGPLPRWAQRPMGPGLPGRVSSDDLWLLDGFTAFFTETLRRARPGIIQWKLNTERRDIYYQQPELTGLGIAQFAPTSLVAGVFGARGKAPRNDHWLAELYDRWLARASSEAPVGEAEDAPDVEVVPIEGDPEWDVEIWIPESAEATLGSAAIRRLEGEIAGIPGIERLGWEDRERFPARLRPGTNREALREAIVRVVRSPSGTP